MLASADDDGHYWLVVHDVQMGDTAEYACQARSIVGEAWCYGELFVNKSGFCVQHNSAGVLLFRFILLYFSYVVCVHVAC